MLVTLLKRGKRTFLANKGCDWLFETEVIGNAALRFTTYGRRLSPPKSALGLDFNPSTQQIEQNVLPVFDSLVFF